MIRILESTARLISHELPRITTMKKKDGYDGYGHSKRVKDKTLALIKSLDKSDLRYNDKVYKLLEELKEKRFRLASLDK